MGDMVESFQLSDGCFHSFTLSAHAVAKGKPRLRQGNGFAKHVCARQPLALLEEKSFFTLRYDQPLTQDESPIDLTFHSDRSTACESIIRWHHLAEGLFARKRSQVHEVTAAVTSEKHVHSRLSDVYISLHPWK
ncbi:hypothetical protein F2P81_023264 [Scophthalmus maximus]|uniref:Uncharacterized protein n=1 Tax=Scophthalmus maximus TaxID=52904 RepID=A0A6A4RZ51_SCOMX|nr:hypothetical protein F2P81_023264 [Scophthalmus maximus]